MIPKPCTNCDNKRFGCMCKAYSEWINDVSPLGPTLKLPKRLSKFNPPIFNEPLTETQKYTGGSRIAGFRGKRKEI